MKLITKIKNLCLVLILFLLVISVAGSHAQNKPADEITIVVPRNVITQMVTSVLPLRMKQEPYFRGDLWIHSIDHLEIGSNTLAFDMNIRGKNIKFETKLGNRPLVMDVGNFDAAFSCNASLRYDVPKQVLYITPYLIQKPDKNETNPMAANLLQLITLTNGVEYPIELQNIPPVITQIIEEQFNINAIITHIYTENNKVFINGRPRIQRIK